MGVTDACEGCLLYEGHGAQGELRCFADVLAMRIFEGLSLMAFVNGRGQCRRSTRTATIHPPSINLR
jgi:hypothetical protein